MTIVNRFTGEPPTEQEQKAIERRALQILASPYSSPEQVAWAIDVGPPGCELAFWESTREKAIRQRKEQSCANT